MITIPVVVLSLPAWVAWMVGTLRLTVEDGGPVVERRVDGRIGESRDPGKTASVRLRSSGLQQPGDLGHAQHQHKRLAVRKRTEAELLVEARARSSMACTTTARAPTTLAAASARLAASIRRSEPRPRPRQASSTASCPSRMTGTGSGMLRPTRDDSRRRSTELAARL